MNANCNRSARSWPSDGPRDGAVERARRLRLTFAAADRQIPPFPVAGSPRRFVEPIRAPSLRSRFSAIGNRRAVARMKSLIIFDLDGTLAERKGLPFCRPPAPNFIVSTAHGRREEALLEGFSVDENSLGLKTVPENVACRALSPRPSYLRLQANRPKSRLGEDPRRDRGIDSHKTPDEACAIIFDHQERPAPG